jgi:hypothetical protein
VSQPDSPRRKLLRLCSAVFEAEDAAKSLRDPATLDPHGLSSDIRLEQYIDILHRVGKFAVLRLEQEVKPTTDERTTQR